jgi:hypothetical protein
MPELGKSFRLNLADAFVAEMQILANLAQGLTGFPVQSKTPAHHLRLPWRQALQGALGVIDQGLLDQDFLTGTRLSIRQHLTEGVCLLGPQGPI